MVWLLMVEIQHIFNSIERIQIFNLKQDGGYLPISMSCVNEGFAAATSAIQSTIVWYLDIHIYV